MICRHCGKEHSDWLPCGSVTEAVPYTSGGVPDQPTIAVESEPLPEKPKYDRSAAMKEWHRRKSAGKRK